MKIHIYETQVTVSFWIDVAAESREQVEKLVKEKAETIEPVLLKKVTIHGVRQLPDYP